MPWNDPNALLGIGGIVVGLIGLIVSVFLYFRSKSKKILEYEIDSTQLMTKTMTSIPNLKVTINDQPVESLTSTTIKFSNAGNQSIVLSDFATKEPLGITIKGCLYSYDVSADNPNSTPSLHLFDNKTFYIEFDFLKQKQSFTITLLHDGKAAVFGELTNGERRKYRHFFADRAPLYISYSISFVIGATISFIVYCVRNPNVDHFLLLRETILPCAIMLLLSVTLISELVLFLIRKLSK